MSDQVLSVSALTERRIPPLPLEQPSWGNVAVGTVLGGSYKLNRKLAQGGMGDIYLASHERLPGAFVVKILSPDLAHDNEAFVRFQREAVVMTAIHHPNVVQVVDFNSTPDGMPYLVMEYLPGQDLSQILSQRRALTPNEVSRIVRKVAYGLDAAHRLGIVHRDLKPENIMIVPCPGQQDVVKVIDFGISKARRFGSVTATSTVIGTPEFMSPEQAQGQQEAVDARSDQFALAVISYLLLTGQTPWGTAEPVETLRRVVNRPALPMSTHVRGSFASVESVLFRAMSKRPNDRYPSTLAFSRAFDRALVMDGLIAETATPEPSTSVTPAQGFGPEQAAPSSADEGASAGGGGDVVVGAEQAPPAPWAIDPLREGFVRFDPMPSAPQGARPEGVQPEDAYFDGQAMLADDSASPAPPSSRDRPPRQRPRRARYVWESAVLVLALVCGTAIGFLDLPTVRAHTVRGLGAVRTLVTGVQRSTATGVQALTDKWRSTTALAGEGER
ncbi:MAG: serine/threonine-protein kinase [Pseudomonadota bacterium]